MTSKTDLAKPAGGGKTVCARAKLMAKGPDGEKPLLDTLKHLHETVGIIAVTIRGVRHEVPPHLKRKSSE